MAGGGFGYSENKKQENLEKNIDKVNLECYNVLVQ